MNETANVESSIAKALGLKTIAIVGLSDKPERPSYGVAHYLKKNGYMIVPINPNLSEWDGAKAYPSLIDARKAGEKIEVVDIFRKSEDVPPIVDDAIAIGAKVVWMQLGVINEDAAQKAKAAGIAVVMDRCMKIEHAKLKR